MCQSKAESIPFQCGVYTKSYETKAALRRQLQLHSSDFICRKCSKSFTSELDLENHKSKTDSEKEMMVRLPETTPAPYSKRRRKEPPRGHPKEE